METGARSTLLRPELVEISPVQRLRQCRCERSTSQRAPACQMPKEGSPRAWVWPLGATCRDPSLREPLASGSGQRQRRRTARAAASLRAEHGALDVRGKSPPWSVSRNAVKPVTQSVAELASPRGSGGPAAPARTSESEAPLAPCREARAILPPNGGRVEPWSQFRHAPVREGQVLRCR